MSEVTNSAENFICGLGISSNLQLTMYRQYKGQFIGEAAKKLFQWPGHLTEKSTQK